MPGSVSESEFYMWRAVFALGHTDNRISSEEVRFMAEAFEDEPFSEEQRAILSQDIQEKRDVMEMFGKISESRDRVRFFRLARRFVWVDGDYAEAEQKMMLKLISQHMRDINVDELIGAVDLSLEDEQG